ncbi:MAG: STAS domain-containing protein [Anaerolineae bacterium]|nr:STAS domain-containing protein [Anaerolineae bacterium]
MSRRGFVFRLVVTIQGAALVGVFLLRYAVATLLASDGATWRAPLGRELLYAEGAALLVTGLVALRLSPVLRFLGAWNRAEAPAPGVARAARARALSYPFLFQIECLFLSLAVAAALLALSARDPGGIAALEAVHAVLGVAIALAIGCLLSGVLRAQLRSSVLSPIADQTPAAEARRGGEGVSVARELALTVALLGLIVVLVWGASAYAMAAQAAEQAIADERGRWLEQVVAPQVRALPAAQRLDAVAPLLDQDEAPFLLDREGRVVGPDPLPYDLAWSQVSALAGSGAVRLYRPEGSPVRILAVPLGIEDQVLCVAYPSRTHESPALRRVLRTGGGIALACLLLAVLVGGQAGLGLSRDLRRLLCGLGGGADPVQAARVQAGRIAYDEVEALAEALGEQRRRAEAQLDGLRSRVASLEKEGDEWRRLAAAAGATSASLIPAWDGVAVAPLVGHYDEQRAAFVRSGLLAGVAELRTRVLVIDLSGVTALSEALADCLARTARAVALMGRHVVLSGVGPEVAWSLAHMSADLGRLPARRDLGEALAYARTAPDAERQATE